MADDLFTREIAVPLSKIFQGAEKEATAFFNKLAKMMTSADVTSLAKAFKAAGVDIDKSMTKAARSSKQASSDISKSAKEQEKAAQKLESATKKTSTATKATTPSRVAPPQVSTSPTPIKPEQVISEAKSYRSSSIRSEIKGLKGLLPKIEREIDEAMSAPQTKETKSTSASKSKQYRQVEDEILAKTLELEKITGETVLAAYDRKRAIENANAALQKAYLQGGGKVIRVPPAGESPRLTEEVPVKRRGRQAQPTEPLSKEPPPDVVTESPLASQRVLIKELPKEVIAQAADFKRKQAALHTASRREKEPAVSEELQKESSIIAAKRKELLDSEKEKVKVSRRGVTVAQASGAVVETADKQVAQATQESAAAAKKEAVVRKKKAEKAKGYSTEPPPDATKIPPTHIGRKYEVPPIDVPDAPIPPKFSEVSSKKQAKHDALYMEESLLRASAAQKKKEVQGTSPEAAKGLEASAKQDLRAANEVLQVRKDYLAEMVQYLNGSAQSLKNMQNADKASADAASRAAGVREGGRPVGMGGPPGEDPAARAEREGRGRFSVAEAQARLAAGGVGGGAGAGGVGGGGAGGAGGEGEGPGGGGMPPPPIDEWRASIQRLWDAITKSLSPEQIGKLDVGAIFQAAPYRQLAGRHAEEFREEQPQGLVDPSKVGKIYKQFTTTTKEKMSSLVRNLEELLKVAEAPGLDPSSVIARAVRDISQLTSKGEAGVDVQGSAKDIRKYLNTTTELVQGAMKKVIGKLLAENYELEKKIREAAKEGKTSKVEELSQLLVSNMRQIQQVYDAAENAGQRFNINLQKDTKGQALRPPSPIPEAQFRFQDTGQKRVQKEFEKARPEVLSASGVARDFAGITDEAERIKATFDSLFAKARPESLEFRKNLTGVIEALRIQASKGLINRAEADQTIKTLKNYLSTVRSIRLGEVGLGRAGPVSISSIYETAGMQRGEGAGGGEREMFRQMERVREQMFQTMRRGEKRIQVFEIQDPSGAVRKLNVEYRRLGNTLATVKTRAKETARILSGREMLGQAFRRVALWGTAAGLTYGAIGAFRDAINVMVEAESGVISLSKVMEDADVNFKKFDQTVTRFVSRVGIKFAASMKEAYDVMRIFAQQGKNMADTQKLTEASFLGANVSILKQTEVAEALTAATKQFNIEADKSMDIVDAWNEVANRNAVTMKTLADATKKAGAAAKVVGIELEQFIGLVTAISEATRQPGKEIGTSLRFIFQRTLRPETQRTLATPGIDVSTTDLQGNFKGFIPIITELADKWGDLNKAQKLSIAQALGGARQYNVVLALMENYDTAVKAAAEATHSQGSAQRENTKYMKSAAANMKKAKAALDAFYVSLKAGVLPVITTFTTALTKMSKFFAAMPGWLKGGTVGMVAFAAILARVAQNLDYVLASGAGAGAGGRGGALAFLGGATIGRARSIESYTLEQRAAMAPSTRAARPVSDLAGLGLVAGGGISAKLGQGDILQKNVAGYKQQAKWVDVNNTKMTKLTAVVKRYGVQTADSTQAASLGISSLNSPILMVVALMSRMGQFAGRVFLEMLFVVPRVIAGLTGIGKAAIASSRAMSIVRVQSLGLVASLGLFAAAAYGIYRLVKAYTDAGEAARKSGKKVEEAMQGKLTSSQRVLRNANAEIASLKQIENRQQRLNKLRAQTPEQRVEAIREGSYKSPLIQARRFDELQQKAGAAIAKVDPAAVESMDKYGRVIFNTSRSMLSLADAAVAAKASIVAIHKTKVAVSYAQDANDAFKSLANSVKEYSKVLPALKLQSNVFGQYATQAAEVHKLGDALIASQDALTASMAGLKRILSSFPKSTPIDSFLAAVANKHILKAFNEEAKRLSRVLIENGRAAATAYDVMNQQFMKSRGFKGVGVTGEETKQAYLQKNVYARTFSEIDKQISEGKKALTGRELIVFGPKGPFGLTQAQIVLGVSGEYMVKGISKFGEKIVKKLSEVRSKISDDSQELIFDPTKMVELFNTSIAKVTKQLGGAGAGLVKLKTQIEIGTKFAFELPALDRLKATSTAVSDMVIRVAAAQQGYLRSTEEFEKRMKQNPLGKVAIAQLNDLNERARIISNSTFIVSLANEISKLGAAAERASYDMQKANIEDIVSQQFGAMTTSAKGFTKDLTFELPKLGSQLSPAERVAQTNPDLAGAVRASGRALDIVKQQARSGAVLTKLDLPKMFKQAGAQDLKRFFDKADQERRTTAEAIKKYGGNKAMASLGKEQRATTSAVTDMKKAIVAKLDEQMGKKPSGEKEGETSFGTSAADQLMRSIAEQGRRLTLSVSQRAKEDADRVARKQRVEEARRRSEEGSGDVSFSGVGRGKRASVKDINYTKLFTDAARKAISEGRQFARRDAVVIRQQLIKYTEELLKKVEAGAPSVRTTDKPGLQGLSSAIGSLWERGGKAFQKYVERPVRRHTPLVGSKEYGKEFTTAETFNRKQVDILRAQLKALRERPVGEFLSTGRRVQKSRVTPYLKPSGESMSNKEIIDESRKNVREMISAYGRTFGVLIKQTQMQIQKQKEMIDGIAAAAVASKEFTSGMESSLRGVLSFGKQLKAIGSLTAPIVGAGAGIPQGRINIGKASSELGLYERLYKRFPGFVGDLTRQEQVRQKVLGTLPGIYDKLQSGVQRIRELSQDDTTDPTQRLRYQRIIGGSRTLWDKLTNSVRKMNNQMAPLLKSFAEMQRLEQVGKNIENIVKALKKAEDLEFDTTSIDKALGRHPLAPTAGVFGQPAGLSKFERQQFELDQKRRTGAVSGGEYEYQKRKLEFERDESVIQYQQAKENAKLQQETDSAKRAMGILWDAQYQGIGGLQPLIDTIKSDLETAGDVSEVGGKRTFQGVPSLQGMQKEIAKVQEQQRAKNLKQHRDIVMKETESLLQQLNETVRENQKIVADALKEVGGKESVDTLRDMINTFEKKFGTIRDALIEGLTKIEQRYGEAAKRTGTGLEEMAKINTKFAEAMGKASESFKSGTGDYAKAVADFVKAVADMAKATAPRESTRSTGTRKIVGADKGVTGVQQFASGGYISGKPGLDTISTNLPVGGFVMSRPAVQRQGLSNLNRLQKTASSGASSSTGSIPAKVTTGEFVFGPQAVGSIGLQGLTALNRGVGGGKGNEFGGGGLVSREEWKRRMVATLQRDSSSGKVEREAPDLDRMTTYQLAARRKQLIAQSYREPQVGVTYRGDGTPKVSKEAANVAFREVDEKKRFIKMRDKKGPTDKKIDTELLGEQLGRGGGYIKVGDTYVAYGRAGLVDEGLKTRGRVSALRKKYEQYKKGKGSLADLTKLSGYVSLSGIDKIKNKRDHNLVRALQGGWTPNQYDQVLARRKYIKEQLDPRLDRNTEIGKHIIRNTAKQDRLSDSSESLYGSIAEYGERQQKRLQYARDRYKRYQRNAKGKTPAEKQELYRKMVNSLRYKQLKNRGDSAEQNSNMYRLIAMLHTRGVEESDRKIGFIPGVSATASEALQKSYKGSTEFGYTKRWGGKDITVVRWKNPATGGIELVDKSAVNKDGDLVEKTSKDEYGNLRYDTFRVPLKAAKTLKVSDFYDPGGDRNIEEVTRGVDTTDLVKSIFGKNFGRTSKGAVGVSQILPGGVGFGREDITKSKYVDKSKFEQFADTVGLPTSKKKGVSGFVNRQLRQSLGTLWALKEMAVGIGKLITTDPRKSVPALVEGLMRTGVEATANLGLWEGDDKIGEASNKSILYALGGRYLRKLKGYSDKGDVDLSAETTGKWSAEIAATIGTAGIGKAVKGLSVIRGFKAGSRAAKLGRPASSLTAAGIKPSRLFRLGERVGSGFGKVGYKGVESFERFAQTGVGKVLTKERALLGGRGTGFGFQPMWQQKTQFDPFTRGKDIPEWAKEVLKDQRKVALKGEVASETPLKGFAAKYADIDKMSTADLLKQSRGTASRYLLRGVGKLGRPGKLLSEKAGYFFRRKLKTEQRRALELGLDPASRQVSKRGYKRAKQIISDPFAAKKGTLLTSKYISKSKLAREFLQHQKGLSRADAKTKVKRRGKQDVLTEAGIDVKKRQKELLEAGYKYRKYTQQFTPKRTLSDLFGRKRVAEPESVVGRGYSGSKSITEAEFQAALDAKLAKSVPKAPKRATRIKRTLPKRLSSVRDEIIGLKRAQGIAKPRSAFPPPPSIKELFDRTIDAAADVVIKKEISAPKPFGAVELAPPGGKLKPILGQQAKERALIDAVRNSIESGKPFSAKDILGIKRSGHLEIPLRQVERVVRGSAGGVYDPKKMSPFEFNALKDFFEGQIRANKGKYEAYRSAITDPGVGGGLIKSSKAEVAYYEGFLRRLESGKPISYSPDAFAFVKAIKKETKFLKEQAESLRERAVAERALERDIPVSDGDTLVLKGKNPGVGVSELKKKDTLQRFASGGFVGGNGGSRADNVPAMLSAGEYVIPANVVKQYGTDTFDKLISGQARKYAKGGMVQKFQFGGVVESVGSAFNKVAATIDVFITGLLEQTKRLKVESSSLIEPGKVITSKIPLAIAEADEPEEMPDYVKAGYARPLPLPKRSAEEQDFVESYALAQTIPGVESFGGKVETVMQKSQFVSPLSLPEKLTKDLDFMGYALHQAESRVREGDFAPVPGKLPVVKHTKEYSGPGSGGYAEPVSSKVSQEKQSDAVSGITDALESAAASFKTAITDALNEAKVSISDDSIKSVNDAVKRGVEDGSQSISNAIKQAVPSGAGGATGLGAAVRPEVFQALESRVEILGEKINTASINVKENIDTLVQTTKSNIETDIRHAKDQSATELNERLSNISTEVAFSIRAELQPQIRTNVESIAGVNHETKGIQSLVHQLMAKMGDR